MSFFSGLVDAGKDRMMEHAVDQVADAAKDKVMGVFGIERKKKEKESGGIGGLFNFGDKDKKKKEEEKGSGGGVIGGFLSFLDQDKKEEKKGGFNGLYSAPPPMPPSSSGGGGSDDLNLDDDLGDMAAEMAVEKAT